MNMTEQLEAWQAAYDDFVRKHRCIESITVKDIKHHGDSWSRLRTYTAKDGANFYEIIQFPITEYGLRVEFWSDDAKSVIFYL
jgi:hypothetical protein